MTLIDEKEVIGFNKKHADEIKQDKQYWAIKKGIKRRQRALEQLTKDTYLIQSLKGKQYTAILSKDLEDVVIECPCKVDIVFHMNHAYIVDYFPEPILVSDLESQEKDFKDLGGDY
jgi:hypothetical protein